MTENEKRKEGDDLMICFVIHESLLSFDLADLGNDERIHRQTKCQF